MKVLIVLPAYNEEKIVRQNLQQLAGFCQHQLTDDWQIVVADNKSTDKTKEITQELAVENSKITYYYLPQRGKGLAVVSAWQSFPADFYCFMDIDLATDIKALPELIKGLKQENYDLVIGSRRHSQSVVKRSFIKKVISRGYGLIVRLLLNSKLRDHPCGFKAVNQKVIKELLPQVKNDQWFFDTELLILAERSNFRIKEVPVQWAEHKVAGRKSQVKVISLIFNYLKEVWQLKQRLKS